VFPLPEKLLLIVFVPDVGELIWSTSIYRSLHIDDVAYMSFVVLVISKKVRDE